MNKDNLRKLLTVLKSKKKLPLKFDMSTWLDIDHSCGTVGCLVGLSSHVITPRHYDSFDLCFETWSMYSERVFKIKSWSNLWSFIFDSQWGANKKTNTKAHAIKRIEYVLKYGRTPKKWDDNWGIS